MSSVIKYLYINSIYYTLVQDADQVIHLIYHRCGSTDIDYAWYKIEKDCIAYNLLRQP